MGSQTLRQDLATEQPPPPAFPTVSLLTRSRTNSHELSLAQSESEVAQSCPALCDPGRLQSMEFSRQEYWSGLSFPSPGDLPHPGFEPGSPTVQADAFPSKPPGKPPFTHPRLMAKAGNRKGQTKKRRPLLL